MIPWTHLKAEMGILGLALSRPEEGARHAATRPQEWFVFGSLLWSLGLVASDSVFMPGGSIVRSRMALLQDTLALLFLTGLCHTRAPEVSILALASSWSLAYIPKIAYILGIPLLYHGNGLLHRFNPAIAGLILQTGTFVLKGLRFFFTLRFAVAVLHAVGKMDYPGAAASAIVAWLTAHALISLRQWIP